MPSQESPLDIKETCRACFYAIIIAMWLEAAVAIVANILAIVAFFRAERIRKKVSNYFILNLSIADLLIGVMAIPLSNMMIYYGYWPYGKVVCKVWLLFVYACTMLSGFALVLISWDRFLWVRAPLAYIHRQSKRRAISVIAATAVASYVFVSVVDVGWEAISGVADVNYTVSCESEGIRSLPYAFVTFAFEFLLPAGLLATFNVLVFVKIRRVLLSRRRTESGAICLGTDNPPANHSRESSSGSSGRTSASDLPSSPRSPGTRAYRKSAVMLSLMTGAFVLCWCPWFIAVFVNALGGHVSGNVLWGVSYLMFANSAINPFLYASTNVHYKAQMMSFFCFCRRR